jgi:hypothetical protein
MKRLVMLLLLLVLFITGSSVHAAGISVSSNNGDMVAVMRNMKIDKVTAGNIVVVMGNLDIEENVSGNVLSIMGNVKVNSKVSGQIVTILGDVELTEGSEVYGNSIYVLFITSTSLDSDMDITLRNGITMEIEINTKKAELNTLKTFLDELTRYNLITLL